MKLTGELKEKVEEVDSLEKKKSLIAEAGMELTDDELEGIAGGIRRDEKLAQPNGKLAQPNGKLAQPNGRLPR